jgi:hypothetical protein
VQETFRQGHDVQLHIHPQWSDAQYSEGKWQLNADWSILNYSEDAARQMIRRCKQYLENLLRTIEPAYSCVSFRSGSWCIAPSPHMLRLLVEAGIVFDMSIVGGVRYQTRRIDLDYRECEEDFLPFYPVMTDARKVSRQPEPIICVPTNHFYGSRRQTFQNHMRKALAKLKGDSNSNANVGRTAETYGHEWAQTNGSVIARAYHKGLVPYVKGRHLISDLAQLDYTLMHEMLDSIRRRARAANVRNIPVILENHTKDIRDFTDIGQFVADVSDARDVKCVTLTDLASGLQHGRFPIKKATT